MEAKDFVSELLAAGITQAEIAEETGIPQPTVSKIFRGSVRDVLSKSYRRLQAMHTLRVAPRGIEPPLLALPGAPSTQPAETATAGEG